MSHCCICDFSTVTHSSYISNRRGIPRNRVTLDKKTGRYYCLECIMHINKDLTDDFEEEFTKPLDSLYITIDRLKEVDEQP
jgi:hypothetical protein